MQKNCFLANDRWRPAGNVTMKSAKRESEENGSEIEFLGMSTNREAADTVNKAKRRVAQLEKELKETRQQLAKCQSQKRENGPPKKGILKKRLSTEKRQILGHQIRQTQSVQKCSNRTLHFHQLSSPSIPVNYYECTQQDDDGCGGDQFRRPLSFSNDNNQTSRTKLSPSCAVAPPSTLPMNSKMRLTSLPELCMNKNGQWKVGERIRCLWKGNEYTAKIMEKWEDGLGHVSYKIHYVGWNKRMDEVIGQIEAATRFRAWDSSELPPGVFPVERVCGKRIFRKRLEYLVRWEGYDEETWEPANKLIADGCSWTIDAYEKAGSSQKYVGCRTPMKKV